MFINYNLFIVAHRKQMVRYSKQDSLGENERMQLISACKSEKESLVIKGLLYSGMRAGEFANMKEHWVDWQRECIHVPSVEGKWKPKTKAGAREIPINFEVKQILYKWFQTHKEIGMDRVTIYRIVKRVGKRLRPFKKVYPHSLRATFATMMAANDMQVYDIQAIMGWAKIDTANSYIKSVKSMKNFRDKMKNVK